MRHQRTTFPLTPGRKSAGSLQRHANAATYVVCLDCGKEFAYDWKAMRVGEQCIRAAEPLPKSSRFIDKQLVRLPATGDLGIRAQDDGVPRACGRRQIRRFPPPGFVRQHRERDRLLRIGIDAVIGRCGNARRPAESRPGAP